MYTITLNAWCIYFTRHFLWAASLFSVTISVKQELYDVNQDLFHCQTPLYVVVILTHQSAITLKSLTGDMNNIKYLITMAPLIHMNNKQSVLGVDVSEAGKMNKHKDQSDFVKTNWVKASPKWQLLWSMQWILPTNSIQRKNR